MLCLPDQTNATSLHMVDPCMASVWHGNVVPADLTQGLIAGGTYMGEVYVWDLAQEGDYQVFKSTLSASSHQ